MPLSIDLLISRRRLILRLLLILLLVLAVFLALVVALAGAVAAFVGAGDGVVAAGVVAGAGAFATGAVVGAGVLAKGGAAGAGAFAAGEDGIGAVVAAGGAGVAGVAVVAGAPVFGGFCASAMPPGTHKRNATADRQEMVRIEELPRCTKKTLGDFRGNPIAIGPAAEVTMRRFSGSQCKRISDAQNVSKVTAKITAQCAAHYLPASGPNSGWMANIPNCATQ